MAAAAAEAAALAARAAQPELPAWLARRRAGLDQEVLDKALSGARDGPNRLIRWSAQNPWLDNFFNDPRLTSHRHAGQRSVLALAAAAGDVDACRKLLRCGAVVDTPTLCHAVWSLSVEGVAELLRAPLLLDKHERRAFQCATASAPVLVLLRSHQEAAHEVLMGEARRIHRHDSFFLYSDAQKAAARAAAQPVLAALEVRAVRLMELLAGHGFGINVYREVCGVDPRDGVWRVARVEGLQPGDLDALDVHGRNKLVWQAFRPEPWSTATHRHFAPAFQRAVRSLLLAASRPAAAAAAQEEEEEEEARAPAARRHRTESEGERCCAAGAGAAGLAALDGLLLLKVCEYAAHPLSAWLDVPDH